ncbi:MAG: branched-chain amino acid dehydrogenase [Candidatus Cloacimonetes bacterium HGW-Cloacimonetes-1]|jgi:3-oxoacid CoA-transferase A subunit|nr:MAG: branched-chain amino acid dehydrogenase [Candidatus Cloacimonetes bacterium HGW-Cloacimonetes-1]
MRPIISARQAVEMIKPHARILFGGFLAVGAAETLIDELVKINTKDLHIVVIASDYENRGIGKLVVNHQVKSAQLTHLGTNKEIQKQMNEGEIAITLIPQGTLLECVRASGAGLGGVLTPTGLGTVVEEGKQIIRIEDKDFILEKAIPGDFALIHAWKADKLGNLIYRETARNSNPVMAMAGTITIAEVDEIVEVGELDPEQIVTPGVFVDYLVLSGGGNNG